MVDSPVRRVHRLQEISQKKWRRSRKTQISRCIREPWKSWKEVAYKLGIQCEYRLTKVCDFTWILLGGKSSGYEYMNT